MRANRAVFVHFLNDPMKIQWGVQPQAHLYDSEVGAEGHLRGVNLKPEPVFEPPAKCHPPEGAALGDC